MIEKQLYGVCLNALFAVWNLPPDGVIRNDKSAFPNQLPFQISEVFWGQHEVTVLAKSSWMTRQGKAPDALTGKGQMNTHTYYAKDNKNKTALIDLIAEEKFTARDLLITFSRDRLCMTATFCVSANTFKKKAKPHVEHIQQHPLPVPVCALTVNFLSLSTCVL